MEEGLVHEVLKRTIESDHVESPIRVRQGKQHSSAMLDGDLKIWSLKSFCCWAFLDLNAYLFLLISR